MLLVQLCGVWKGNEEICLGNYCLPHLSLWCCIFLTRRASCLLGFWIPYLGIKRSCCHAQEKRNEINCLSNPAWMWRDGEHSLPLDVASLTPAVSRRGFLSILWTCSNPWLKYHTLLSHLKPKHPSPLCEVTDDWAWTVFCQSPEAIFCWLEEEWGASHVQGHLPASMHVRGGDCLFCSTHCKL